jgi:hypothetical protein
MVLPTLKLLSTDQSDPMPVKSIATRQCSSLLQHAFGRESDPGEFSQPINDRKALWMDWMITEIYLTFQDLP